MVGVLGNQEHFALNRSWYVRIRYYFKSLLKPPVCVFFRQDLSFPLDVSKLEHNNVVRLLFDVDKRLNDVSSNLRARRKGSNIHGS